MPFEILFVSDTALQSRWFRNTVSALYPSWHNEMLLIVMLSAGCSTCVVCVMFDLCLLFYMYCVYH